MLDSLLPLLTSGSALGLYGAAAAVLVSFLMQRRAAQKAVLVAIVDSVYKTVSAVAPLTANTVDDKVAVVLKALDEYLKYEVTEAVEKIVRERVATLHAGEVK